MIHRIITNLNGFCVELEKKDATRVADLLDATPFCNVTEIRFSLHNNIATLVCYGLTPMVNCLVEKQEIFSQFVADSNVRSWTTNKFSKAMREFAAQCEWIEELNPQELTNDNKGRIIRQKFGKSVEMYYVKTYGVDINPYQKSNEPF